MEKVGDLPVSAEGGDEGPRTAVWDATLPRCSARMGLGGWPSSTIWTVATLQIIETPELFLFLRCVYHRGR